MDSDALRALKWRKAPGGGWGIIENTPAGTSIVVTGDATYGAVSIEVGVESIPAARALAERLCRAAFAPDPAAEATRVGKLLAEFAAATEALWSKNIVLGPNNGGRELAQRALAEARRLGWLEGGSGSRRPRVARRPSRPASPGQPAPR